jgi:hypothetical protein
MTALFFLLIAQERTAQSAILSVRSERYALSLKERHRSQNQGSLKSEERKSDFKERCAQLWQSMLVEDATSSITYLAAREDALMDAEAARGSRTGAIARSRCSKRTKLTATDRTRARGRT